MRLWCAVFLLTLTGCAGIPTVTVTLPASERLANLPPASERPVVAVYSFKDLTGQRKSRDNLADFSTAVTQGGEAFVIDALKTAGKGKWFRVVQRNQM